MINEFTPFVSIIVPVYNVSEYIDDCLQSIAAQDYKGRMECVIIDDCGNDDSLDHVHRFINSYHGTISFSVVSHDHNKGLSAARNTGICHASGEYLLFVDSDDIITENAVSSLAKPLKRERFDVVFARDKRFGLGEGLGLGIPGGIVLRGKDIRDCYLKERLPIPCWNKLYNAEFLSVNSLSFYDGILHEDQLWSLEVALKAKSLCVLDIVTYHYRVRIGSIVVSDSVEMRNEKLQSLLVVLSRTQELFISHGIQRYFEAHDFLEHSRLAMFKHARYNWPLFSEYYKRLRNEMPVKWNVCACMNGWHVGKQVRDLHLLFPAFLGTVYYFVWWHAQWLVRNTRYVLI